MKKIAVVQDLSGLGKCSLTAAIPVISVMGVQACPFPTAVLSNQTGYASYYCDDYTDRLPLIMEEWKKREFHPDGIFTGFLAGETQAEKILEFLDAFQEKETLVLVDPVLGDQGEAYGIYTEGLCENMRSLVKRAEVSTPNLTELMLLLYGKEGMEQRWKNLLDRGKKEYLEEIEQMGFLLTKNFGLPKLVVTGIDVWGKPVEVQMEAPTNGSAEPYIGNLIIEDGTASWKFVPKEGGSFSGTGDLFASVLCAGMVKGISMKECVEKASAFLSKAIQDAVQEGTDRNDGVCFEKYLGMLL